MESLYHVSRWLGWGSFLGIVAAFFLLDRLPPPARVLPELARAPIQRPLPAGTLPEAIAYRGIASRIDPVAGYELWGVVVSHNDPAKWWRFDHSHDERSLNTRDLCVAWGYSAESGAIAQADFHSSPWMCWMKYGDVALPPRMDEIANNHIVARDEALREKLLDVEVGDQIHLKGRLVDYTESRWSQARRTSTRRDDTGNGACEIVLIDALEILRSENRWVRVAYNALWWVLGISLAINLWLKGDYGQVSRAR